MEYPQTEIKAFSIIIPTWNNLPYLKLCVESLLEHSAVSHQIVIHVNEGVDGTLDWVRENELEHTFSEKNVGVCTAVNQAFLLAKNRHIVYMNDDMYACPAWDSILMEEIQSLEASGVAQYLLSSTMIEPHSTSNPCVVVEDFGHSAQTFNRSKLLSNFQRPGKQDWQGSTWPPCLVPRELWESVGGFSEEFSPGAYSDPDFVMKLWDRGCRVFKGLGKSRVYHFGSKSTGRVKINDGRKQFLKKWGILPSCFTKYYLRRGESYSGPLTDPTVSFGYVMKRVYSRAVLLLTT